MTASADPPRVADAAGADVLPRFLAQLGHALIASGEAVAVSEDLLRRIARAHGVPRFNVVALPTVLFVKLDDGVEARLDFTSEEGVALTFDQIDRVFALARDAEARALAPEQGLARLQAILAEPPRFGPAAGIAGHMLMTVGIALCLKPTLAIVGPAAAFGLVVGALKVFARNRGMLETLLPTASAFVVAALALTLVKYGIVTSPLRLVIAALVTFLPGGILAIATMDLAYADIVSGASRFVTGIVHLLFLVLGMTIAASVVGLPPERLLVEPAAEVLAPWAAWLGVLAFGVGCTLHYGAALRALPWMLVALAIAMAAQIAGNAAFGGYMSGFVGALFATPGRLRDPVPAARSGGAGHAVSGAVAARARIARAGRARGTRERQSAGRRGEFHDDAVHDRRDRARLAGRRGRVQRVLRSDLPARAFGGESVRRRFWR